MPGFKADEIPMVIASLKDLIVSTLEQSIKFPVKSGTILPPKTYAFPKTASAQDLMMDSPGDVDENQLDELRLNVVD